MASAEAAAARRKQHENENCTMKVGDLRTSLSPSLGIEWNDNVGTSDGDRASDFIFRPALTFGASYLHP
jgi:hypothetical protein